MAAPVLVALVLALGRAFTQGSPIPLAAAGAGTLVILAIYGAPWDRVPRWVHTLPVFGGVAAVFVIQATVRTPGYGVGTVLLVFPLYLTTVLFAALYLKRNEVWAAAALASIGILALAITSGNQAGEPALSILVLAVLWVVVLTVHAVVRRSHSAEERIRLLISSVKDYAILTLDPTGHVTSWSAGAEQIKGYKAEEIVGRHFSCFYSEEDVKAGKPGRELAEAARVGRLEDEGWRIRKDGSRFWADVVITALRDEDGRLRGFGKVTRDISERKQSEDAIRALNAQLVEVVADKTAGNAELAEQKRFVENLLQNLNELGVGLVVITGQTIEYVNDAFTRMTGYGQGAGRSLPSVSDMIAPEYLDEYRRQFQARAVGEGDVIFHEFEIIASDGHRIPVESIARSEVVDGAPHGVAMVLDITERKKTEHALAESRARLQAIIDTSLTAIVTMDQRGVITGWNPRAEATFGWPANEIVGRVLADTIVPEQHRAAHRAGIARYLDTGEGPVLGKVLELTALDRSGREFPVELAISPASEPGGNAQFVGFVRDITARRQSQEAIEALNRALQVANQHKSEFLANMSHELRTPLNAILGFSELLLDDTSNKFDLTTRQKFLDRIHSSGSHLLGLINDILDLSKVEAGRMVLTVETVSVVDVVAQVLSTMEPIAAKKGVRTSADVADGAQLQADAGKLKQMLLNLVSNAVKFTPEGGSVTISARQVSDVIEISVADTGIGIAEADLNRLFKDFQQLDAGPGRRQEGTGLGLALTKRLAELHGGEIRVASEPGKGSVFTLRLPLRPTNVEQSTPKPLVAARASDLRPLVLVVEDNQHAADLLVHLLDRGGFRADVAVNGTEALAKARNLQPVAITLDILLPGIDGWDVLTGLKQDAATRDIPVVVITVVDKPELGRALGAMDYFVKPVDGKALLARLSTYAFTSKVENEETRVLVVDDEPANVQWLESVLKPAGFSVLTAPGGREGITLAKAKRPHLILLDLIMPEVSGFDVVEALHEDAVTRSIPIMILTAKDLTDDDKSQLNGNVAAILARGSTGAPDLLDWLRRLMAARPAVRQ
jgi:PAS domain S-box-containing protein